MTVWYNPELDEIGLYDEFTGNFERERFYAFWSMGPMLQAGWILIGVL